MAQVDWQSVSLFLALVILWSVLRPDAIRDYDGRRLPSKPVARFLYTLLCMLAYLSLVAAFAIVGPTLIEAAERATLQSNVFAAFKDKSPVLGAVTLATALQFTFFRDIDRSTLIWLHSARHLYRDGQELIHHLQHCPYTANPSDMEHNKALALRFGIRVDGSEVTPSVAMQNWRKVAILVRLVREWNNTELSRVLSASEMVELETVERAHERKTQVILEIIRLTEQAERGLIRPEVLLEAVKSIGRDNGGYEKLSDSEFTSRIRQLVAGAEGAAINQPIRMTPAELKQDLTSIERYFAEEYDILLTKIAELTSKSIVLAGDAGPQRLAILKEKGFGGLGRMEVISFDRILWLFLSVAFLGFLVLAVGSRDQLSTEAAEGVARFAFIMAIATLIGSIVGSHRHHARADETPWASYIAAGAIAGAVMLGVNWGVVLVKTIAAMPLSDSQKKMTLITSLPWTLLPAAVTVAICRLGRLDAWPGSSREGWFGKIYQRTLDGIAISIVLLLGMYGAVYLHALLGVDLPEGLKKSMLATPNRILPIPVFWPLQVMGFIIGFAAVYDVRRAAQTRILSEGHTPIAVTTPAEPATARG